MCRAPTLAHSRPCEVPLSVNLVPETFQLLTDRVANELGAIRVPCLGHIIIKLGNRIFGHRDVDEFLVRRTLIRHYWGCLYHADAENSKKNLSLHSLLSIYQSMKRGPASKDESRLVNFYVTIPLLRTLDDCVSDEDTDRAKFIRSAIREKIERIKDGRRCQTSAAGKEGR